MKNFEALQRQIKTEYDVFVPYLHFTPVNKEYYSWWSLNRGILYGRINPTNQWVFFEVLVLGDNCQIVGIMGTWELNPEQVPAQVQWCREQFREHFSDNIADWEEWRPK